MLIMKLMLLLWDLIKLVLKMILYYPELYLVHSEDGQQNKEDSDRHEQEVMNIEAAATSDLTWFRFQVPGVVPVVIDTESVKKQLPVVQYRDLILRKTSRGRQRESQVTSSSWEEEIVHVSSCTVCMNGIEGSDEVRELCSCEHVFHKDCLDGWIDQAHLTCPLCRSQLFIPATSDPWRAERMVYLFGQDIYFGN